MGLFDKGVRRNWLIVCHFWFVDSLGWEYEYLMDATKSEAEAKAALIEKTRNSSHKHCETKVIELPDMIAVIHQPPTDRHD